MLYSLTGFPFDLFIGIAIAFVFRPAMSPLLTGALAIGFIVPGFFIPSPHHIIYWMPGGLASLGLALTGMLLVAGTDFMTKGKNLSDWPDRRLLRQDLVLIESLEERQQQYMNLVNKMGVLLERNNDQIIRANTAFYVILFFSLFAVNFSALSYIYFQNPEIIRNLFSEFYTSIVVTPGKFDEWFAGLMDLAAFQIFVAGILFSLLVFFITDRVLRYRQIRQPAAGHPAYFRLPFYSLWVYIASGLCLFGAIELAPPPVYRMIATNVFAILSALYIFQGLSIVWLYLQVRLLPTGTILAVLLILSILLPVMTLFVFGIFLILGLLEFWADLRKKALQPNLMSNGV